MIKAPFDSKQIDSLKRFQECGYYHPFTCGKCRSDLEPTPNGWICSVESCNYTQDWCHEFMANNTWEKGDKL